MPKQELGRVRQVELTEAFDNEPHDFTPWLADNLDLIGTEIGLNLELEDTEVPVGDFSLDILATAREVGSVAIENQLGQSDHPHLGQLMTYAAGVNARALVWVAPTFRPEHLAAVNYLNEWTAAEIIVFAIEVRALKIEDSLVGADFRVIAGPRDWARRRKPTSQSTAMNDNERTRRIAFFKQLGQGAKERELTDSTGWESVVNSKSFPCRDEELKLKYWVEWKKNGVVSVHLDVRTGDVDRNRVIIQGLTDEGEQIERDLGFVPQLLFPDPDGPHGRMVGRVVVLRDLSIGDPPEQTKETLEWCWKVLEGYQRVLEPRLKTIVKELEPEESEGVDVDLINGRSD